MRGGKEDDFGGLFERFEEELFAKTLLLIRDEANVVEGTIEIFIIECLGLFGDREAANKASHGVSDDGGLAAEWAVVFIRVEGLDQSAEVFSKVGSGGHPRISCGVEIIPELIAVPEIGFAGDSGSKAFEVDGSREEPVYEDERDFIGVVLGGEIKASAI